MLARLRPAPDGGYLARPMRVLDAGPRRVVGVFRATGSGGGVIEPAERRARRDLAVPAGKTGGARTGELVVGETEPGSGLGLSDARVVERLGDADSPGAISLAAIHAHGLPMRFPDEALAEAEQATAPGLEGRADLRALPLVTIDGADARDFDDAVWAEADSAPDNPGGWRALVAIADVAHFVQPGSVLDRAARGARQLRLLPRPRGADAARGALRRPLLAEAGRGPCLPRRAPAHRRRGRTARLALRARAHALRRTAHL